MGPRNDGMPGVGRHFYATQRTLGMQIDAFSNAAVILKQKHTEVPCHAEHEFPAIRAGMPMHPNIRARFHGIEEPLNRGLKLLMNIQVFAATGGAGGVFEGLLQSRLADDEGG